MNRKYLRAIIYTSVFSVAYGSFFYHRYTSRHSIAAPLPAAEDHISASSALVALKNTYLDENKSVNSIEPYDTPDVPTLRNKKRANYKKKTQHDSSFTAAAVYSVAKRSPVTEQLDYSQQAQYSRTAMGFTSTTDLSYTSATTATKNISAPQNTISANSNTSNNNTATQTFIDQSVAESDGSEFLPDGSSQQDLFTSQSKNPRVYTIKNYQTADISCTPSYGESSPHAKLMRGLKGC